MLGEMEQAGHLIIADNLVEPGSMSGENKFLKNPAVDFKFVQPLIVQYNLLVAS